MASSLAEKPNEQSTRLVRVSGVLRAAKAKAKAKQQQQQPQQMQQRRGLSAARDLRRVCFE